MDDKKKYNNLKEKDENSPLSYNINMYKKLTTSDSKDSDETGADSNLLITDTKNIEIDENKPNAIDIILEKIGYTSFHYALIISCGLFFLSEGVQTYSVHMLMPTFYNLFAKSSEIWLVNLASDLYLGFMIGNCFSGVLSRYQGRSFPIKYVLIIFLIMSVIVCSFENIVYLSIIRFIQGICMGIVAPQCINNLSEFLPSHNKELVILSMQIFYRLGVIYFILVYKIFSPDENSKYWRYNFILSTIPVLIATLLMNIFFRDSPKLQLSRNELNKSIETVNYLASKNSMMIQSEDINTLSEEFRTTNANNQTENNIKVLFNRKYCNVILLCTLIYVSGSIINVSNMYSLPSMLTRKDKIENKTEHDLALRVIFPQIVTIPAILLSAIICRFIGRKNTIILGFTFCLLSSGFSSIFQEGIIITSCLVNFFIVFSISCTKIFVIEAFPTKLRDFALAFCFTFSKLGDTFTPLICNLSFKLNDYGPMFLINTLCIIGMICSLSLPYDTLNLHIE